MGVQYAALFKSLIRDFRKNGQEREPPVQAAAPRGYTGKINSGESGDDAKGVAACPYEFYGKWISDLEGTRKQVESFTRSTVGTAECPIDGIPNDASSHR